VQRIQGITRPRVRTRVVGTAILRAALSLARTLSLARCLAVATILAVSPTLVVATDTPTAATTPPPAAASPAPEPEGFWTGPINSAVPATIAGGRVVSNAHRLRSLLKRRETIIVDVSNAPRRPDNLATGAPWLPLPHRAIPGSLWIPGAGLGQVPATVDEFFRKQLATATGNDLARQVIVYCHRTCWLSWNAAKRAIGYGYRHVYWYRDGIEGWQAAHFPTAVIEPRVAPEG
jgi:PQQ-dependent catabolism-associated CXXCW motif protein